MLTVVISWNRSTSLTPAAPIQNPETLCCLQLQVDLLMSTYRFVACGTTLCFSFLTPDIILWDQQTKENNSARQTRGTTTKTGIAYGNSTWRASKYKVYKLHQRYILKKRMPPVACVPSISDTLGDTGVYRHTTEPIFIRDQT